MRDVRAIAGYVASADGQSYVVVSLINDPHAEAARAAHDELLEWVYQGPSAMLAPAAEAVDPEATPRALDLGRTGPRGANERRGRAAVEIRDGEVRFGERVLWSGVDLDVAADLATLGEGARCAP